MPQTSKKHIIFSVKSHVHVKSARPVLVALVEIMTKEAVAVR
jgi:hypothetical protein